MINLCPKCSTKPNQNGYISCSNNKCLEFEEPYFIWDWQKLTSEDEETRLRKMLDTNTD